MRDKRSPFKFLSPYRREDAGLFFGREAEVDQLYKYVFESRLLLVYGQSGAGKTSLVQCGLAGRFRKADWLDLYVRHNGDINASLAKAIREKLEEPPEEDLPPLRLLYSLYLDHLCPIYLIFDQLEELFILGTEEEQQDFIRQILAIIEAGALPCKVIFIIREEYLAYLYAFEKEADSLFSKRLRVEPMSPGNARRVIIRTSEEAPQLAPVSEEVARRIVQAIQERQRVRLPYLQVFLDRLYRLAPEVDGRKVFDEETVAKVGALDDVLATFLEEQIEAFEQEGRGQEAQAISFLKTFVSRKGTRRPLARDELNRFLPGFSEKMISGMLGFFEGRRILDPMENGQFELAHDSLAAKLFQMEAKAVELPALGGVPPPDPPFPGLLPYSAGYSSVFFGRDEELEALFDKIVNDFRSPVTLLYGPLGVGKTSLIRAALAPRLEQLYDCRLLECQAGMPHEAGWIEIFNQPPDGDDPGSLLLGAAFGSPVAEQEQRRFILFDQLEELFAHLDAVKLQHFYRHVRQLLKVSRACGLVFVVREEFFAFLPAFQAEVPELLEKQYRLEPMAAAEAERLIGAMASSIGIEIEKSSRERLLQRILDEKQEARLSLLQAFFSQVYHQLKLQ